MATLLSRISLSKFLKPYLLAIKFTAIIVCVCDFLSILWLSSSSSHRFESKSRFIIWAKILHATEYQLVLHWPPTEEELRCYVGIFTTTTKNILWKKEWWCCSCRKRRKFVENELKKLVKQKKKLLTVVLERKSVCKVIIYI